MAMMVQMPVQWIELAFPANVLTNAAPCLVDHWHVEWSWRGHMDRDIMHVNKPEGEEIMEPWLPWT